VERSLAHYDRAYGSAGCHVHPTKFSNIAI